VEDTYIMALCNHLLQTNFQIYPHKQKTPLGGALA